MNRRLLINRSLKGPLGLITKSLVNVEGLDV